MVQHVEFYHRDHFELRYHRRKARRSLSHFIDFFWETDFDPLYEQYPDGFSDALFPNIGYTYLINLGTPFRMQLEDEAPAVYEAGETFYEPAGRVHLIVANASRELPAQFVTWHACEGDAALALAPGVAE